MSEQQQAQAVEFGSAEVRTFPCAQCGGVWLVTERTYRGERLEGFHGAHSCDGVPVIAEFDAQGRIVWEWNNEAGDPVSAER